VFGIDQLSNKLPQRLMFRPIVAIDEEGSNIDL
jgi:hypothetical protein